MSKDEGLLEKFKVERLMPSSRGIDHEHCRYFVLDPLHDPIARFALRAYMVAANRHGYHALSDDLRAWLAQIAQDDDATTWGEPE